MISAAKYRCYSFLLYRTPFHAYMVAYHSVPRMVSYVGRDSLEYEMLVGKIIRGTRHAYRSVQWRGIQRHHHGDRETLRVEILDGYALRFFSL
jgi:hypothetical protein